MITLISIRQAVQVSVWMFETKYVQTCFDASDATHTSTNIDANASFELGSSVATEIRVCSMHAPTKILFFISSSPL